MSDLISNLNDENFETEINIDNKLVLVDFWADWCGPCKSLAPVIADIAQEYQDEISVKKLNADNNPLTTEKFAVRGLPTMILFKGGKECKRMVGNSTKSRIADFIEEEL